MDIFESGEKCGYILEGSTDWMWEMKEREKSEMSPSFGWSHWNDGAAISGDGEG